MKKNKAALLYQKYEADLKKLQKSCKHRRISDWMDQYWAPGHSTGKQVRVCEECNTVVAEKSIEPICYTSYQTLSSSKG